MIFDNWNIIGNIHLRQFDNKTSYFEVTGNIPEGWNWQLLFTCQDNINIVDMIKDENRLYVLLTDDILSLNGAYYFQMKATQGELVKHTNIVKIYVSRSISGDATWPVIPTEFTDLEKAVKAYAESAKESADKAESASVHSPIIGSNGNWFIWSFEDSRYVDTGISSRGENDIFWLNTSEENKIVETFDEIVAAYKAGKNIWVRDTLSFPNIVTTAPAFLVSPIKVGNDIIGMFIICGETARGSSSVGAIDAVINVTYYITSILENSTFELKQSINVDIDDSVIPNESNLIASAGNGTFASPVNHIHPAPFPYWTSSIGKALFVKNNETTPSQAFEWRDVPNGNFISKVGDFLRVAEVDTQGKPTKWKTETLDNAEGVSF